MAGNDPNKLPREDISLWLRSVKEYVEGAEAKCLDLRTVPFKLEELEVADIQAIFNSLVDSGITELHLEGTVLTEKLQGLIEILPKTAIKKLNLRNCSLTAHELLNLAETLTDTQVAELDVSRNNILFTREQVDNFVQHLVSSHLTTLSFAYNSVSPLDAVSSLFTKLQDTSIESLNLTSAVSVTFPHPRLLSGPYNVLCRLFSHLQYTNLKRLSLKSNQIDDPSMILLGDAIQNSNLEKLDLGINNIGDPGVDYLVAGLTRSKITNLNLSSNKIVGDNSLSEYLRDTQIKILDLSANPISNGRMLSGENFLRGSSIDTLILSDCNNLIPQNIALIKELRPSQLTALEWRKHVFDAGQVEALVDILEHLDITFINLSGNQIWDECFPVLGHCLTESKLKHIRLTHTPEWTNPTNGIALLLEKTKGSSVDFVDVSSNRFGPEGAEAIAISLVTTTLCAIDISNNKIKSGITYLATSLKHTNITYLNLRYNFIEDEGLVILSSCLAETQIIMLNLSANGITSRGAKCLALVLKETKLREVNLEYNNIENDGLESLAKQAKNTCITSLSVKNNPGKRKTLVDIVQWENRRKIHQFADLLKRTNFYAGDSNIFKCGRVFDNIDIHVYIEDLLSLYKFYSEQPFILHAIEQDKRILDLKNQKCFERNPGFLKGEPNIFIENCSLIYDSVLKEPSLVQTSVSQDNGVSLFTNQIFWIMRVAFPKEFAAFIGKDIEADLVEHVSLLRRIEELGISKLVEELLLNRPLYLVDETQKILDPYVYKLLHKYQQPLYNLTIEPKGKEKIVKYFTKNIHLNGASEVISLLSGEEAS